MTARVMIVVTHLLGSGHLARAVLLARAFLNEEHDVLLVSGGRAAPHIDMTGIASVQLPSLHVEGADFSQMFQGDEAKADIGYLNARTDKLLEKLTEFQPDILITELFPFGRRSLKLEFEALLKQARSASRPPRIYASVRDILAPPSKASKAAYALDCITRYYDGVLVHSDPNIIELGASWPVEPELSSRLIYTGFIAPPAPKGASTTDRSILVSAGGGDVGAPVFDLVMEAAKLAPELNWHLLVGGRDPEIMVSDLKARAPETVLVEPARVDFRDLLARAPASVSMCGYNTALDILQTGVPAVVLPYDAGGEVEQGLRAAALGVLPGIVNLPLTSSNPEDLLDALGRAMKANPRDVGAISFEGALQTVRVCMAEPGPA